MAAYIKYKFVNVPIIIVTEMLIQNMVLVVYVKYMHSMVGYSLLMMT